MLRVLMFIFENYMTHSAFNPEERSTISEELVRTGFEPHEVDRALEWLIEFSDLRDHVKNNSQMRPSTVRIYDEDEKDKINLECRGLIQYFEENGILNSNMREMVIDRLMALDADEIETADVKWITLIVLYHHPEEKRAMALMQDMVMCGDVVH